MTDQLVVLPIIYEPTSFPVTGRIEGYTFGRPGLNAYQWKLQCGNLENPPFGVSFYRASASATRVPAS